MQPRDTTHTELGIKDSHWVIIRSNRARTRDVMAPSRLLRIPLDGLCRRHVRTRQDLSDGDQLLFKGIADKIQRFVQCLDIFAAVATAGVQVFECDLWNL
jgi:hypothetical protein